jgi:vitamin B12 transporter
MFLLSSRARVLRRIAPAALGCLSASSSFAQSPGDAAARLDPVVVSATRTPVRVSEAIAEVTVLDRAAIERAEGRTLVELLARESGLQFASNGGLGKLSSMFIRGLESRHTLLLVDGVRVGTAIFGTPSFDNLPLESIERIEIVRGPLSSLYGSDAVGGVIQIFTRRGVQGVRGNAKLAAGSSSYGQGAGGVAFGDGRFDGALQLQHTETRGFSATNERAQFGNFNADRDGFNQNAGTLSLGWQLTSDWRLDGLVLESNGISQVDDGPGVDARVKLRNAVQSVTLSGHIADAWKTRVKLSRSVDIYNALASASAFTDLGPATSVQRQLGWENELATPIGTALALVERAEQDIDTPGEPYTVRSRGIDAIALGLNGSHAGHSWQASVRNDRNSQFGHETTGAAGYAWQFAPAWRAGASLGTSFVAPSFAALYFPFGFGNPNLEPEHGRHAELNLHWTGAEHQLGLAWYAHRVRGFITSGQAPVNLPYVRIRGTTLAYEGRVAGIEFGAALDHLHARNQDGDPLVRRAKNTLRVQADRRFGVFSAGASLNAVSARFDFDEMGDPVVRLPGYATLDLRADWLFTPEWRLGLALNNIADKVYESVVGYNQPGREGYLTLRYAPRR